MEAMDTTEGRNRATNDNTTAITERGLHPAVLRLRGHSVVPARAPLESARGSRKLGFNPKMET
eukprot:336742-Amphidinium_carterae.1